MIRSVLLLEQSVGTMCTRNIPLAIWTVSVLLLLPVHITGQEDVFVNASEITWVEAPESLPPGATIAVIEGNPAEAGPFTFRVRVPDGYRLMPHTHAGIEHVTVLSGSFRVGQGETADFDDMLELRPGGFMAIQPGHPHYAEVDGETVIQIHGIGPWDITYVDPRHDPRHHH